MPKKKSKKPEKDKKKQKETEDKEEKQNEELDLEDVVEDSSDINLENFEFRQFLNPEMFESSPILERVASGFSGPRFFSTARANQGTGQGNVENGSNGTYLHSGQDGDEAKYMPTTERVSADTERVSFENIGRDKGTDYIPKQNQEQFMAHSESRDFGSINQERVKTEVNRVNMQEVGRKSPFERDEKKYDPKKYEAHSR